jgi:LysR family transcriptional regulator, hypochlorite-specific transcription factor HypT
MEARWLEDFLSVARTGSFSLSAAERHITQSAFSRRIKSLEQWVGVALIDRSSYPTRLTPAGQRFQAAAREATAALLTTRQELRQAARADRRLLRIAIQHSLASGFLARWLATLPLASDDLLVQVRADNLHDCVRDLEEGNVDLLVCYTHPGLPLQISAERYPSLTLARDILTPVSKAGTDGRPLHALRPGAAGAVPWLSYSADAQLGRVAALALDSAEPPLAVHPVFESALVEALRATALAGLGVAWLPGSLIADDLNHKRLVRAGPVSLDVPLRVRVFAERSLLDGRLRALWDCARELAADRPDGEPPTQL